MISKKAESPKNHIINNNLKKAEIKANTTKYILTTKYPAGEILHETQTAVLDVEFNYLQFTV